MRVSEALNAVRSMEDAETAGSRISVAPELVDFSSAPPVGARSDGDPARFRQTAARTPILPFLGVLVHGQDRPLFAGPGESGFHPSVSYVQKIYLAILINWFIDALGLGYLSYGYLLWLKPRWAGACAAAILGTALSTALASFASGLVLRPLRLPTRGSADQPVVLVTLGAAVLASAVVLSSAVWSTEHSQVYQFAVYLSWLALALALMVFASLAFGVVDVLYITARLLVMFSVGYVVAGPLHLLFFHKEIHEQWQNDRRNERDKAHKDTLTKSENIYKTCLTTSGYTDECRGIGETLSRNHLLVRAYQAQMNCEDRGLLASACDQQRAPLREQAQAVGLREALGVLQRPLTGKRGDGPEYASLHESRSNAAAQLARAESVDQECRKAQVRCRDQQPAVQVTDTALTEQGAPVAAEPGPIERAEALEKIREKGRSFVQFQFHVAWLLAFIMPFIVLAMKLTGGAGLEPYLYRRWKGR